MFKRPVHIALFLAVYAFCGFIAVSGEHGKTFAQQPSEWELLLPLAEPQAIAPEEVILPGLPTPTPSALPLFSLLPSPTATISAFLTPSPFATITATPTASPSPTPAPAQAGPVHVPVLMYHYVRTVTDPHDHLGIQLSVTADVFEAQMRYLSEHQFTPISPADLFDRIEHGKPLPPKPVLLTFDDGYADFFTAAQPILSKYNFKATIFIPSDLIGNPNYLSWDQLKQLAQIPTTTIAGHTRHHVLLPQVAPHTAEDEIAQGRQILQKELGVPVDFFAYPYGGFNEHTIQLVKNAGYRGAFSTMGGTVHDAPDAFHIRRVTINGLDDLSAFASNVGQ